MDESIRRAALRATAKVALAMTVMGCLGEVRVDSAGAQAGEGGDQPATPDPLEPGAGGTGGATATPDPEALACEAPYPDEAVILDSDQLGCCEDLLGPLLPAVGEQWDAWNEVSGELEVQGCCRVAVAHFDADPVASEVPWETLGPCCDAIGFPSGPACTPWGPAVPPAVLGELPMLGVA